MLKRILGKIEEPSKKPCTPTEIARQMNSGTIDTKKLPVAFAGKVRAILSGTNETAEQREPTGRVSTV